MSPANAILTFLGRWVICWPLRLSERVQSREVAFWWTLFWLVWVVPAFLVCFVPALVLMLIENVSDWWRDDRPSDAAQESDAL